MKSNRVRNEDYEKRIKNKYNYWKKVGYTILYDRLSDGTLKVTFTNKSEGIPCYLEYKKTKVVCYGDYSSFVFENYFDVKCRPDTINYKSVNYIIGKIDNNIKTKEYDSEYAVRRLKEWKKQYVKDYFNNTFYGCEEYIDFKNKFEYLISDVEEDSNGNGIWYLLERFFGDIDYPDWWEEFDDIGMVYTSHVLAQLVMMRLIDEDWENNKIDCILSLKVKAQKD